MDRNAGRGRSWVFQAGVAGLIGVGVYLLLTGLCAIAFLQLPSFGGKEKLAVRFVILVVGFLTAYLSINGRVEKKLAAAAVGETVILLFLILMGMLSKNSSIFNLSLLKNVLCLIAVGLLACLLRSGTKKRRRRRS